MTQDERYQIVSRLRKIMADTKEAGKIEKPEYRSTYELGELRADLRTLCRELEIEKFPVEEAKSK